MFAGLELDGESIVEIRPRLADYPDYLLFDPEGRLLDEISAERELVEGIYRVRYIYDGDANLIEREEYDRDDELTGKALFEVDSKGQRVENRYYVASDGTMALTFRLTWSQDNEVVQRINFFSGKVIEFPDALFPKTTTEFSETQSDDGHIIEERRYSEENSLTLRKVTRYDRSGNKVEYSCYDHELDGEMYIKQEYEYEFDSVGNWTTQTVFRWVVGWGPFRLFPYSRTRRTIEYF